MTNDATIERDPLTEKVIGAAIEVHRHYGPGLLESAYEHCLCFEFVQLGLHFQRQLEVPLIYKGTRIECGFRADIVVENQLIVELKCVDKIIPIHEAQLLTYMKILKIRRGLILNFNVKLLKDGIHRMVL
jgi:GxxExxY protein